MHSTTGPARPVGAKNVSSMVEMTAYPSGMQWRSCATATSDV